MVDGNIEDKANSISVEKQQERNIARSLELFDYNFRWGLAQRDYEDLERDPASVNLGDYEGLKD